MNQGRIEQVGAPLELYHRPRNLFVAGFIGSPRMNFIKGQVLRVEAVQRHHRLRGDGSGFAGEARQPEAGRSGDGGDQARAHGSGRRGIAPVRGTIDAVEQLGESSYVYMKLASGDDVIVRAPGETEAAPGGSYTAHVPVRALHVFDAAGVSVLAERG